MDTAAKRRRFHDLHTSGCFVLPNPWDVGSALLLQHLGFPALATTSSGFAATLGRDDQRVTRDELVPHVAALAAATDVPLSVDAENGYADTPAGIAETVELLAAAGAAGLSVEDYDPVAGRLYPVGAAAERIAAAAEACTPHAIVLTARAENHLYGVDDLDDTVARLVAYREAGATAVYAPGLTSLPAVRRVVAETGAPVNVLALPGGPSVPELAGAGVRRVSTGGALAWAAYGALVDAAHELRAAGTTGFTARALPRGVRAEVFRAG
jgi:2-methylisocitrate lyase-like PEP mutase family enzyme